MKGYRKKYFACISMQFLLFYIVLVIQNYAKIDEALLGIYLIISSLLIAVNLLKDQLLYSATVLGELLLFSFGLYELHLVNNMPIMAIESKSVIILSIYMWELVCLLNPGTFFIRDIESIKWEKGDINLKYFTYIVFCVSSLLIISEWIKGGGIPILRPDMETFRFTIVYNSVVHILAMCIKFVPMFVLIYVKFDIRYLLTKQLGMMLCMIMSFVMLICTAFRGELMISITISALIFLFYKKPKFSTVVKIVICFAIIMGIYPVLRSYMLYGKGYILDMMSISTYPKIWFITPLYQTFASSFHYLNRDFNTFPLVSDYGYGKYTILSNIPFLNIESLGDAQNRIWHNGFYAELTPTVFGSLYADFGYIGCVIGMMLISVLCNFLLYKFIRHKNIKRLVLYTFVYYKGMQMIYNNTFDFTALLYYIFIWAMFTFIVKKRNGLEKTQ